MLNFNDVCEMGTDIHHARLAELAGELRPDDAINKAGNLLRATTGNPVVEILRQQHPQ